MNLTDPCENLADEVHRREVLGGKQLGTQAVVDIVGVIGDIVG